MVVPDHGPAAPNDIAVVQLVLSQLTVMESRLIKRLDDQAEAARNRWRTHDEQHDDWEKALKGVVQRLDDHLRSEENEDLAFNARFGPLKRAGAWVQREWRWLLVAGAIVIDWASRTFTVVQR